MTSWFDYPISHGFFTTYDPNTPDTPHFAVDLATPQDTPVTAFKSGVIEQEDYAVWNGKQGGGEVWVKPDDGTDEYYFYHLDDINVKQGQHVSVGDRLGLSGGQNSGGMHNTDPMWSTGPELHFGFFTNWINTPIGTMTQGPDPTGTINLLKGGGVVPNSSTSTPSNVTPINMASVGTKIGLFVIALIVVIMGCYTVFKPQIDTAVKGVLHRV